MATPANYLQEIDSIIRQHPHEVAGLLSHFGVDAPVTVDTLLNAILVYKEPFLDGLYGILQTESSADGDTEQKGKFYEFMVDALKVLKGINDDDTPGTTTKKGGTPDKEEDSRILGIDSTLFYVLLSLVLLVIILIIIRRVW